MNIRGLGNLFDDLFDVLYSFKSSFSMTPVSVDWFNPNNQTFCIICHKEKFFHATNIDVDACMTCFDGCVLLYVIENTSHTQRSNVTMNSTLCDSFFIQVTSSIFSQPCLSQKTPSLIYHSPANNADDFVSAHNRSVLKTTQAKLML